MIDAHTVAIAGFVSQATFALTFGLLAWSDRRTRGMAWLACAAILQFMVTSIKVSPSLWLLDSLVPTLDTLLFVIIYMGLRWFAVRRGLRTRYVPAALAFCLLGVPVVAWINPIDGQLAARVLALAIISFTVRMLWTSRLYALRLPLRISSVLLVLLGAILAARTLLALLSPSPQASQLLDLSRSATLLCTTPLLLSFLGLFVAETNRRLHEETRVDSLTGLRNRRALEETAGRQVQQHLATDAPLALLMMDLDHFKQLNDTWGHGLGDRALRAMGSLLLAVVGDETMTARMGGEEFAVLLPGYGLEAAAALAERVRAGVEDLRLAEGDQFARLTVSVGVSLMQAGERTWAEMMGRADDALYRAKREGRNRVALSEPGVAVTGGRMRSPGRTSWRKHLLMLRQGPML